MANIQGRLLRKLHTQMGALLDEFETNCAAEKAAKDGTLNLAGPETPVNSPDDEDQTGSGAMDSRSRGGKTKSMSDAFGPNFNRIPNFK